MASHESFYTPGAMPSSYASSPTSSGPPPPPPKPYPQSQSTDPSRSGTPQPSTSASLPGMPFSVPSGLSNLNQSATTGNNANSSPRPLPPIPPTPQTPVGNHTPKQSFSGPPTPAPPPQLPQTPQQSQQQQQQQQEPPRPQIPPPPFEEQWLPSDLSAKPISELTPILANPQLLAALASQHPSYASSLEPVKAIIVANLALARQVAQIEAQLSQLRDQTTQLLLNHTSLQTQWRRKQSEMDDALSPWGPRAMYQRLVSSIGEQESLLRATQESFLDGTGGNDAYYGGDGGKASDKEVTDWIRRIREGTTTLEKRREMRARWDEGRVGGWR